MRKGQQEGILGGDATVLFHDCGGRYMSIHLSKPIELQTSKTDCTVCMFKNF